MDKQTLLQQIKIFAEKNWLQKKKSMLHYDVRFRGAANGFYLISSLILPVGLWVIFEKAGFDLENNGVQSLIFGALFLMQWFPYLVFRKTIFHKVLLIVGSLYLMAYIVKIIAEYFVMSLGWPLALVLVGFMLIIVGSLSFHFSKKYLLQP